MFTRTYDREVLTKAIQLFSEHQIIDIDDWIADIRNKAFSDEEGNVLMFEYLDIGQYFGHWFFFSRGKDAVRKAREMVPRLEPEFGIKQVVGLTPTTHKGAMWLTRQVGCKDHGIIETRNGPCLLTTLGKVD